MLEFEGLNYWAIIVAWLVNAAVGAYWYSPKGFSKQWTKHTGIDILKIPEKQATNILLSVLASALVQAFILALVINSLNATTALHGLAVGAGLWLGFVAATTVGTTLYSKRSWRFWWLNSSYFLIVMLINAVVLAIWR